MFAPRPSPLPFLLGFACASVASTLAATPIAKPGETTRPARSDPVDLLLTVARNGDEVLLGWDVPEMDIEIRQLEIMRHTQRDQKGRGRVATVRVHPGLYNDRVPDPSRTYWYWLKITLADGRVIGAGPVQTPAAEVWSPGE